MCVGECVREYVSHSAVCETYRTTLGIILHLWCLSHCWPTRVPPCVIIYDEDSRLSCRAREPQTETSKTIKVTTKGLSWSNTGALWTSLRLITVVALNAWNIVKFMSSQCCYTKKALLFGSSGLCDPGGTFSVFLAWPCHFTWLPHAWALCQHTTGSLLLSLCPSVWGRCRELHSYR